MTALTSGRAIARRDGTLFSRPVAAGVKIYTGALVVLSATKFARPGATALNLVADGVAESYADNTNGVDGVVSVTVRAGCFPFANSAGADLIAQADIGNAAYIVDDQTVAKTDGGGTRSKAGTIIDIDASGVWIGVGILHP